MQSPLRVVNNVLELIGSTPMVRLNRVVPAGAAEVWVKLEAFNPGFSIKDRAALGMIEKAEQEGLLHPGDTIVEATAGNTGVGLALVGVQKGYKVVFFVPEKFSKEKVMLMEGFGARVIARPPSSAWKRPFARPASSREEPPPLVRRAVRQPRQPMDSRADHRPRNLGADGGQGGCFHLRRGYGRNFHRSRPGSQVAQPQVIAAIADTENSVYSGQKPGTHDVEGVGSSFIPGTFDPTVCDETPIITDAEAFAMVKRLAVEEGILGGSSSGCQRCRSHSPGRAPGRGQARGHHHSRLRRALSLQGHLSLPAAHLMLG